MAAEKSHIIINEQFYRSILFTQNNNKKPRPYVYHKINFRQVVEKNK